MHIQIATCASDADDVSTFQIQRNGQAAGTGVRGVVEAVGPHLNTAIDGDCWVTGGVATVVAADSEGE